MTYKDTEWEEMFDEEWADAGLEYPNRKSRIKFLIKTLREEAIEHGRELERERFLEIVNNLNAGGGGSGRRIKEQLIGILSQNE